MSVTPKQLARFIEEQERLFSDVQGNRTDYYAGQKTRTAYLKARTDLPKAFFVTVATFITPTRSDMSWINQAAKKTLKAEELLVPAKDTGLSQDEFTKLCILEARYGVEFIDNIVNYNFNELIGTDYKHEMLKEGWMISEERQQVFEDDIKTDFKTAL